MPLTDAQMRNAVALAIQALRRERGWTQRELCRRAGLSPAYLSELEAAQKDASADMLERLAGAFGIGIDQLVWVVLLGMIHGEIPGIQRRNEALDVARQVLEISPDDRQDVLQYLQFLQWRRSRERGHTWNRQHSEIVDESEQAEPERTED